MTFLTKTVLKRAKMDRETQIVDILDKKEPPIQKCKKNWNLTKFARVMGWNVPKKCPNLRFFALLEHMATPGWPPRPIITQINMKYMFQDMLHHHSVHLGHISGQFWGAIVPKNHVISSFWRFWTHSDPCMASYAHDHPYWRKTHVLWQVASLFSILWVHFG